MLNNSRGRSRGIRPLVTARSVAVAAVAVALATTAACGGSSSDSSSGGGAGKLKTLTIAQASPLGDIVTTLAQEKGYFADEGLKVKYTAAGNNTATFVTSGQSDLAQITFVPALSAALKGASTTIIFAANGGANGGSLFAKQGTTLQSLAAKKNCKIATVAQGTATYGFAQLYKKTAGLKCQTVTLADAGAQIAALQAGRVDAFITTPQYIGAALKANKLTILIDTRKPADRAKYGGPDVEAPGVGFWGITSHLKEKRPEIQAFLKAHFKARQDILKDPEGAVDALMKTDLFKNGDRSVAEDSVSAMAGWLPALTGTDGYITETQWASFLRQAATYGLPNYDVNNPKFAYSARVDMSYYVNALGKPKS